MKIARDVNGNKILKIESSDFYKGRGFSIQTNGNLPFIHEITQDTKVKSLSGDVIQKMKQEIYEYIKEYGTTSQKLKVFGSLKNNK